MCKHTQVYTQLDINRRPKAISEHTQDAYENIR